MVWKMWLFELGILPFSVIICTLPRIVGHQVIKTDVFQTPVSCDSVCPIDSLHIYPCCLDRAGLAVPTVRGPSAYGLRQHGYVYPLDSSGFFSEVIAKQQIAGLVHAALSRAQTPTPKF